MNRLLIALSLLAISTVSCAVVPPPLVGIPQYKTITLTWPHSLSPDVVGYEVCYGLVSDTSECEPIPIGSVTSYKTPELLDGDYNLYVSAVSDVNSEWMKALTIDGADFVTVKTKVRPVMTNVEAD